MHFNRAELTLLGYKIKKQFCKEHMDTCWLHFIPESPLLSFNLAQYKSFAEWTTDKINIDPNDIISSIRLFMDSFSSFPKIDMLCVSIAVFCKKEAILLLLIEKYLIKHLVSLRLII